MVAKTINDLNARLRSLTNQIDRLGRRLQRLEALSRRYSWLRLAIVATGLPAIVAALLTVGTWLFWTALGVLVLILGVVVALHLRVERAIRCHTIWRQFQQEQVARATLNWERMPASFRQEPRPEHPFEVDLDLVGPRSLHRLIDIATTHGGSRRLRDWLTEIEPDPGQTSARQAIVREMIPRSLFRNRLVLNATLAARGRRTWRAENLLDWVAAPPEDGPLRRWLVVLGVLAGVNALLLIGDLAGLLPPVWQITWAVYLVLWLAKSGEAMVVANEAVALQAAFQQLRAAFGYLEHHSYRGAPHLRALCAPFLDPAHRPSHYLARIGRVVIAVGLRSNPLLAFLLNAAVPWDFYFAYLLSQHKSEVAGHAPGWIDAWFDLEALSSLANLAWLNPHYTLPRFLPVASTPGPVFSATGLGHPLLPTAKKVCNDFTVPTLGEVGVITGSNMAGKTVFIKTVGVNLALAQAGGPVDAHRLETMPFRLFASMGIADSVTDGISFFYAEVRRLKALLVALHDEEALPLYYFIDEILRGTNNRERRIGSRAYVRALAGARGLGLIATHDLALAALADEVSQVHNYHLRDQVTGDRMVFDYLLRPGPSPTTNALRIMEIEGLPVEEPLD
ncbi:MAG: hypothetical protein JXA93_03975 [Anaerolineae bacterium]|nr:hypothetical protein [Anaerolineae bacterium]